MSVIEDINNLKEKEQIIEHIAEIQYILGGSGIITWDRVLTTLLEGQLILFKRLTGTDL